MAITEERRHQLYTKLEQVLGREEATVLMEHLPPVGWADVATKRDLDGLEARLEARLEAKLERSLRTYFMAMVASNVSFMALAFAAARLV
ncbi:MAG: hypothetical protein ACRD0G_01110 [Acidimicrobiales bacterium]